MVGYVLLLLIEVKEVYARISYDKCRLTKRDIGRCFSKLGHLITLVAFVQISIPNKAIMNTMDIPLIKQLQSINHM